MIQHIQANGINIAYRFDGPANGPVVVLSNSLMSSHAMWDDTLPILTDKYRVLRYDTRGHGQSQVTPAPYSIALLAQDLVGLMDALRIQQAHLVGLSMGGMICQYVGAHHPERVLSLGLCDTASEMPPRSLWEERFATARAQGIAGLVDGTIKRWFVDGFPAKAPDKIATVRTMILATPVEGYLGCASAVRDMAQTTMLLKIKAPTLVLVGKQDPACTVDQSTVLHRMIDGSRMEVIDNAAHLSNIEQPAEFNRILCGFLDGVALLTKMMANAASLSLSLGSASRDQVGGALSYLNVPQRFWASLVPDQGGGQPRSCAHQVPGRAQYKSQRLTVS